MPFGQPLNQRPATNQEIKEEKEALLAQHSKIKGDIFELQEQRNRLKDINGEIKKAQEQLETVKAQIAASKSELEAKQRDFKQLKLDHEEIGKNLGAMALEHIKKTTEILEKESHFTELCKKASLEEFNFNSLLEDHKKKTVDITELGTIKANILSELQETREKLELLQQEYAGHTFQNEKLVQENSSIKKSIEESAALLQTTKGLLNKKQQEHDSLEFLIAKRTGEAAAKAKEITDAAQKEIELKKLDLEKREGAVSLEKNKLENLKMKLKKWHSELREFHGKDLPMNFD